MELTDYADRYIVDRLAVLNGVANVQIGGGFRRALRIWLDTNAMAARGITVQDVENALRAQNVELPAGYVQSQERDYQVRVARAFETPEQFQRLPIARRRRAGRRRRAAWRYRARRDRAGGTAQPLPRQRRRSSRHRHRAPVALERARCRPTW